MDDKAAASSESDGLKEAKQQTKSAYERFREAPVVRWQPPAKVENGQAVARAERVIDLAALGPMTIGDKITIEKDLGKKLDGARADYNAEETLRIVYRALLSCCPGLEFEELMTLSARTVTFVELLYGERTLEIDRPT